MCVRQPPGEAHMLRVPLAEGSDGRCSPCCPDQLASAPGTQRSSDKTMAHLPEIGIRNLDDLRRFEAEKTLEERLPERSILDVFTSAAARSIASPVVQ